MCSWVLAQGHVLCKALHISKACLLGFDIHSQLHPNCVPSTPQYIIRFQKDALLPHPSVSSGSWNVPGTGLTPRSKMHTPYEKGNGQEDDLQEKPINWGSSDACLNRTQGGDSVTLQFHIMSCCPNIFSVVRNMARIRTSMHICSRVFKHCLWNVMVLHSSEI